MKKLLLALALICGLATPALADPSTKTARLVSSAASDNATMAFNGPSVLNNIIGYNTRASTIYVRLYAAGSNLATCASTDTPMVTLALPASSAFALDFGNGGLKFNFGMCYRITTGSADNDTGAIASGDVLGLNFLAR